MFNDFKLDTAQFLSGPHLAFSIMLDRQTRRHRVELLTDFDMYEMVRDSIRGGVSQSALRHVKVDEPQDPDKGDTLIMLDGKRRRG